MSLVVSNNTADVNLKAVCVDGWNALYALSNYLYKKLICIVVYEKKFSVRSKYCTCVCTYTFISMVEKPNFVIIKWIFLFKGNYCILEF